MGRNAWLWYLTLAVVAGQYYFVSAVGSSPDGNLFSAIGWSAVGAVVLGAFTVGRRAGAVAVVGWLLVAAALAVYQIGDLVYAGLQEEQVFVEFPSAADGWYLAMYPLLVVGLLLIRRAVDPGRDRLAVLDGSVVALAASAVLGSVYMYDVLTDARLDGFAQVVAAAYPLFDVLLVAVAAWLVARGMPVPPVFQLVAAACAAIVVGNAVFNVAASTFSFESGGVADLGWMAFMVFLGGAALHPSAGGAEVTARRRHVSLVPVGAVVAIPAGWWLWADGAHATVVAVTVILAVALLVVRRVVVGDPDRSTSVGEGSRDYVPIVDPPMPREAVSASGSHDVEQHAVEL